MNERFKPSEIIKSKPFLVAAIAAASIVSWETSYDTYHPDTSKATLDDPASWAAKLISLGFRQVDIMPDSGEKHR